MENKKIAPVSTQQDLDPCQPGRDQCQQELNERQQQDLECLSLLKEAYAMRKEAAYLDDMFSSLKNTGQALDPAVEELLKQLDD